MITGISLRRQWVNYAVDPDLSGKIQAQTNNELLIRIINALACVNIPVLRNQGSFNAWSQQRLEYNIILVYIKLLLIYSHSTWMSTNIEWQVQTVVD